jgi:hypothetical protein
MRTVNFKLTSGESIVVYSDRRRIVLQVRQLVHGATDPAAASFKSGVTLTQPEALRVAAELLNAVAWGTPRASPPSPEERNAQSSRAPGEEPKATNRLNE